MTRTPPERCVGTALTCLFLAGAVLTASGCSPSNTADAGLDSAGGGGANNGKPAATPEGGAQPEEGTRCPAGYVVDPRTEQCAAAKGSQLISEGGWEVVGAIAATASEREGAVAYVEARFESAADSGRVVVQRFDASGRFFGEPSHLASAGSTALSSVSIASNSHTYLTCWANAGEVSCSALGEASEPLPVFHTKGAAIAAVHGGQGWLVAYTTDPLLEPANIVLQGFTENFEPNTASVRFTVASQISSQAPLPLLASTDSGFLAVLDDPAREGRAQLHRFSPQLQSQGAAIDLGHRFWRSGSVAASGSLSAVSLSEAYGSNLMLLDGERLVQSINIPGGGKTGMHQALLPDDSRVVTGWFTTARVLHTQVFTTGNEAPVLPEGTAGAPLGNSSSSPSGLVLVRTSAGVVSVCPAIAGAPAVNDTWRAEGILIRSLLRD